MIERIVRGGQAPDRVLNEDEHLIGLSELCIEQLLGRVAGSSLRYQKLDIRVCVGGKGVADIKNEPRVPQMKFGTL